MWWQRKGIVIGVQIALVCFDPQTGAVKERETREGVGGEKKEVRCK